MPPAVHVTRIESHDTAPGFPDIFYTDRGISGTIELKKSRKAKGSNLPFLGQGFGLRSAQLDWIADEVEAGGQVWIVAEASDEIFCISGRYAPRFNESTFPRLAELAAYTCKKRQFEPTKFRELLVTKF